MVERRLLFSLKCFAWHKISAEKGISWCGAHLKQTNSAFRWLAGGSPYLGGSSFRPRCRMTADGFAPVAARPEEAGFQNGYFFRVTPPRLAVLGR